MDYLFLSLLQAVDWFRWIQQGVCRRYGGECADAARAHKRVDTYGFHPLVNLPFPLDSLAQITDM